MENTGSPSQSDPTESAKRVSTAWDSIFTQVEKNIQLLEEEESEIIQDEIVEAKSDGLGRVIVIQKSIVKHQNGDIGFENTIRVGKTDATKGITLTYLPPRQKECITC